MPKDRDHRLTGALTPDAYLEGHCDMRYDLNHRQRNPDRGCFGDACVMQHATSLRL